MLTILASAKPRKKLIIKPTKKYGNGVFAGRDVKKGEVVHVRDGHVDEKSLITYGLVVYLC